MLIKLKSNWQVGEYLITKRGFHFAFIGIIIAQVLVFRKKYTDDLQTRREG